MSPRISHLPETSLYVDDLRSAKRFYQHVFGLAALLEDERMVALELPGSAVLLLFRRGSPESTRPMPGGVTAPHDGSDPQHLCLAIPAPSLQEWERHLMVHGIVIQSRVIQTHGGTSLYFRDLDGHSVEVATPGLYEAATPGQWAIH